MDVFLMFCRRQYHQNEPDDFLALTLDSTTQRKNLLMIEEYQTDARVAMRLWKAEHECDRDGASAGAPVTDDPEASMAPKNLTLRRVKPIQVLGHGAASFVFKLDALIASLALEANNLTAYSSKVISITTDQGTEFKAATAPALADQELRHDKARRHAMQWFLRLAWLLGCH